MQTLTKLQNELEAKRAKLEDMQDKLSDMKNDPLAYFESKLELAWDDCLNEIYGEQVDALPWYCGSAAQLCAEKDPTFYRVGLNDYADSFDVTFLDEYQELEHDIEDLESEIESLEEEIEDLEQAEEDEE